MPVTPSSIFSLPLANFRRLMAASATWQTWTGSADAAAAAARIHYFDLPVPADASTQTQPELEVLRPCAIISYITPDELIVRGRAPSQHSRVAGGSRLTFVERGQIFVSLEADVPQDLIAAGDAPDAIIDFLNKAGDVYQEILELSGVDDHLVIGDMSYSDPIRASIDQRYPQGDHFKMLWRVGWGSFD